MGTSENSICFVPLEDDIILVGFGFYRHAYESIDQIRLKFQIRVHDENDGDEVLIERIYDEFYFQYNEFSHDENFIYKYDFVERKQWEPIPVKKG